MFSSEGAPRTRKAFPPSILPYPFPTKNSTTKQDLSRHPAYKSTKVEESPIDVVTRRLPRGVLPYPFKPATPAAQENPYHIPLHTKKHIEERISKPARGQGTAKEKTSFEATPTKSAQSSLPRGVLPYPFPPTPPKQQETPYQIPQDLKTHMKEFTSRPRHPKRIPRGAMSIFVAEKV